MPVPVLIPVALDSGGDLRRISRIGYSKEMVGAEMVEGVGGFVPWEDP